MNFHCLKRLSSTLWLVTLGLLFAAGTSLAGDDPSITRITVGGDNTTADIYGANFFDKKEDDDPGNKPPVVRIGWGTDDPDPTPLTVIYYDDNNITVTLPSDMGFGPGDYRVTVANHYELTDDGSDDGSSEEKKAATWDLTIGAVGPQGEQGKLGPAGADGSDGAQGVQGKIGPAGADGSDGAQGIQGKLGDPGPQGDQGLQGKLGDTGPQGEQGKLGDPGPQGVQGKLGDTGPQGEQGKLGAPGPQGVQGKLGDTGPQGEQGKLGDPGPQGVQGKLGETGPQGEQGKLGAQGEQGKLGAQGEQGKLGPQGVQGKLGPQGVQGKLGAQGVQGKIGDTGDQGEQGKLGPQGPVGGSGDNVVFDQPPVNNMQPYLALNYIIALQGTFPSRSSADPFIAEIILFAGNFAPRGWAFCNGQLLSIAQNTALFSLVGTTYGGDGQTTFGLPDLRGRVPVHSGNNSQGPGLSQRPLGQKGGEERTDQPAHNHGHTL